MRAPHTTFAAPFVLVVGCGHPADRPPPESPVIGSVTRADARPVDAACTIGNIDCTPSKDAFGVEARVIDVRVMAGSLIVTLDKGRVDGVDQTWSATLGDSKIPCAVVSVSDRSTSCKLTATDVTATKAILEKK